MQRAQFFLPTPTLEQLRQHAKKTDTPMADTVRRALEQYLKQQQPQQANQGAH
jgi:DNA-binding protein Fis